MLKTNRDEESGTVMLEPMMRKTLEAKKIYPNKRIIPHFIHPHYPFIGEWAREKIGTHDAIMLKYLFDDVGLYHTAQLVWELLERCETDEKILWKASFENLKEVVPYAEILVNILDGRSIITSYHCNLFGGADIVVSGKRVWLFPVKFIKSA